MSKNFKTRGMPRNNKYKKLLKMISYLVFVLAFVVDGNASAKQIGLRPNS